MFVRICYMLPELYLMATAAGWGRSWHWAVSDGFTSSEVPNKFPSSLLTPSFRYQLTRWNATLKLDKSHCHRSASKLTRQCKLETGPSNLVCTFYFRYSACAIPHWVEGWVCCVKYDHEHYYLTLLCHTLQWDMLSLRQCIMEYIFTD